MTPGVRNPRREHTQACEFELILPKQSEEPGCPWPSDTERFLPVQSNLERTEVCDLSQENPMCAGASTVSACLRCLSGIQSTLPATACRPPSRLQLQGLGGLTHLAPIQGREQSTGPRSGIVCTICSQLLSPATPAPLVHNPLEPQDVILRKPAECWPGLTPDATALWFRSVLRQGLSHYATLAALPCNLRSPCWDWRCGP